MLMLAVATFALACATAAPRGRPARPEFDAARLRTGRYVYRALLGDGSDAGSATISVERLDAETYHFANVVEGQFRQTWECTSTAALEPRSATLGLGPRDDSQRTMRLAYEGRTVRGTATKRAPGGGSEDVRAELPEDIVDQRVDWAALMSARLAPGGTISFSVFDPWTGTSPVTAHADGPEDVRVPAGAFSTMRITYRIEKKGRGLEKYVVWVTADAPRFLVREDFPNGSRTELEALASAR
jgi:Protein of unknown function (DUF3108)